MVTLEGTSRKVLPVADAKTGVKILIQKCGRSIAPPFLPFPCPAIFQLQSLTLGSAGNPEMSEALGLLMGRVTNFLPQVFLSQRIFTDTNPLISVFGC